MKIKEKTPIIVFVYNRLECTKRTLEALNENYLVEQSHLFIFSDGAKCNEIDNGVEAVRKYIYTFKETSKFKEITIITSSTNKGLANSVIDGVSNVINKYGKVAVLEDDCVTTSDFILFINEALNFYENKEKIWSISGFGFDLPSLKKYNHDVYLSYRASSLGWATWKDRWNSVDWQVKDYKKFKYSIKMRKCLMRGGNDLPTMLKAQMNRKIDSWAIRWCYCQSKQNKYTVFPKVSRLCNIGFNSGIHSTPKLAKLYKTKLSTGDDICMFEDLELNKDLLKDVYNLWKINIFDRVTGFLELEIKLLKRKFR